MEHVQETLTVLTAHVRLLSTQSTVPCSMRAASPVMHCCALFHCAESQVSTTIIPLGKLPRQRNRDEQNDSLIFFDTLFCSFSSVLVSRKTKIVSEHCITIFDPKPGSHSTEVKSQKGMRSFWWSLWQTSEILRRKFSQQEVYPCLRSGTWLYHCNGQMSGPTTWVRCP